MKIIRGGGQNEYFLFLGRIERIKGLDILLEAFRKLPDHRLLIAGTGTSIDRYREAAKLKHLDNICFTGYLNRPQINETIRKAKAVIVPSQWYETFGMVIIEAFAAGVPAIAGNIGNIGALVHDGNEGEKFVYDSADSMVDAIRRLDTADGEERSRNAYQAYLNNYSPDINYHLLRDIYGKI